MNPLPQEVFKILKTLIINQLKPLNSNKSIITLLGKNSIWNIKCTKIALKCDGTSSLTDKHNLN